MKGKYPVVDKELLKGKRFERALVMHPLPRVDELAYDLDADPRSMYFKQAARGVPIRMALVALLLGVREVPVPVEEEDISVPGPEYPVYRKDYGARCPNPACVSTKETEAKYLKPEFRIVSREPLTLRCIYCEHGFQPEYIASTDWHEGRLDLKRYHRADSYWAKKIRPEHLIIFDSEKEALAHGFKPSHYAKHRRKKDNE